ncbi:MAG: tetratricopeptide repeat protein [Pseudomonadota bacterium]
MANAGVSVPRSVEGASDEWVALSGAVMRHGRDVADKLGALMAKTPDAPAALGAKGLAMLLLGRRENYEIAVACAAHARDVMDGATNHDRAYVNALSAFLDGQPSEAASMFDAALQRHPGDAFALKFAQAIRFLYGDSAGMRVSADAAAPLFSDDHPHAGYVYGCHAFACEETGDLALAEKKGRHGLTLAKDDAWGLHAVAHVHEMRGHAKAGRDWLTGRESVFAGCSNFAHHIWWHSALFELDLGHIDAVLDLYDTRIRAEPTDDYRDVANAVSILMRVESEGVDVGTRWRELAEIAERRLEDGCIVFADLHYLMALLADDREEPANRLIARLSAANDGSEFGAVAAGPGASAADGLAALRRGDPERAHDALFNASRRLWQIGGSHAQRDVFVRATIDAALSAGRGEEARRLITERARRRGSFDGYAMARLKRCGPPIVNAPDATAAAF